jgi:hypothetical protein
MDRQKSGCYILGDLDDGASGDASHRFLREARIASAMRSTVAPIIDGSGIDGSGIGFNVDVDGRGRRSSRGCVDAARPPPPRRRRLAGRTALAPVACRARCAHGQRGSRSSRPRRVSAPLSTRASRSPIRSAVLHQRRGAGATTCVARCSTGWPLKHRPQPPTCASWYGAPIGSLLGRPAISVVEGSFAIGAPRSAAFFALPVVHSQLRSIVSEETSTRAGQSAG